MLRFLHTFWGFMSFFCFFSNEAFLTRIIILFYPPKKNSGFKQVLLNPTEIGFMQMYLLKHPFIDCAQLLTIHISFYILSGRAFILSLKN